MEKLIFTKEEKKEIRKALNVILDDLEELWSLAELEELYTYYTPERFSTRSGKITINKQGIKIGSYSDAKFIEKFGLVNARPKIKDYTQIYYFLKNYEEIRKYFETTISRNRDNKGKGIAEIIELRKKYEKEATIELDLPETMNQHTLSVKKEDGKTIGEIKMGYGTIRIITKGNVVVAKTKEEVKVKKKEFR